MLADNDYCRRGRTMMHGTRRGGLFRGKHGGETKVYVYSRDAANTGRVCLL